MRLRRPSPRWLVGELAALLATALALGALVPPQPSSRDELFEPVSLAGDAHKMAFDATLLASSQGQCQLHARQWRSQLV